MSPNSAQRPLTRSTLALCLWLVALLMTACAEGGGSSGGATVPTTTLFGRVTAGPVANARIDIYDIDTSDRSLRLIATTTTDSSGFYSIRVVGFGPYFLVANSGSFQDEATLSSLSLNDAGTLLSLDDPRPRTFECILGTGVGGLTPANMNTLTRMATCRALTATIDSTVAFTDDRLEMFYKEVGREFALGDVDVRDIEPFDFSDTTEAAAIQADTSSNQAKVGAILAGFSQLAADMPRTGNPPAGLLGTGTDPMLVSDAVATDFEDGVLDGRRVVSGRVQAIVLNGATVGADINTAQLQAAISSFLGNSAVNRSGTVAADYQDLLNGIATVDERPSSNRPPNFDQPADLTFLEDGATQTVSLTNITAGTAAEDSTQTLTFTVTSDNPGVVAPPVISGSGSTRTMTVTPTPNGHGTAIINITVRDDGGIADIGFDVARRSFAVNVSAINDAPSFNAIGNQTFNEDSPFVIPITGIDPGPSESFQTVSIAVTTSNPSVVPNPTITGSGSTRNLSFQPPANTFGSSTITIFATDDGGLLNNGVNAFSQAFLVTINSVNDQPTMDAIANIEVLENSLLTAVRITGLDPGPADEVNQSIAVSATSSDTSLIPNPVVIGSGATRTLILGPVAGASGSVPVTIFVTAQDNGGLDNGGRDSVTVSFTTTITALPVISNIVIPTSVAGECVEIPYDIRTTASGPSQADVTVEYFDPTLNDFQLATQAAIESGSTAEGVTQVTATPAGVTHIFRWNTTADLGLSQATTRLRFSVSAGGTLGNPVTSSDFSVDNSIKDLSATTLSLACTPIALEQADINIDGRLDFLAICSDSSDVTIFLQDASGNGSFTSTTVSTGSVNLNQFALSDFDRNGRLDFVVVDTDGTITPFLQNSGSFTFSAGTPLVLGELPRAIDVGDINRDGLPDLVLTTGPVIRAYQGSGTGFTEFSSSPAPEGVEPTFSNSNVLSFDSSRSEVLVYDTTRAALLGVNTGTGFRRLVSSDAQGSGPALDTVLQLLDDLGNDRLYVVQSSTQSVLSIALASGDRTVISSPSMGAGNAFTDLRSIALDSANSRLFAVDGQSLQVSTIDLSTGDRTAFVINSGPALVNPTRLAFDDLNNVLYILDLGQNTGPAILALSITTGELTAFSEPNTQFGTSFSGPVEMVIDINGGRLLVLDSVLDVIFEVRITPLTVGSFTFQAGDRRVLSGFDPAGLLRGGGPTFVEPRGLRFDVVGDRYFVFETSNQSLFTAANSTGDRASLSDNTLGDSIRSVRIGDMNGDGLRDIVATIENQNQISLIRQVTTATGTGFTNPVRTATGLQPADLVVVDFDRDTLLDVLTLNNGNQNVSLLFNDSSSPGSFLTAQAVIVGASPNSLNVFDFNNDGRLDVVVTNGSNDRITVQRQGTTRGTFLPILEQNTNTLPVDVVVADFNNNGLLDNAVLEQGTRTISLNQQFIPPRCEVNFVAQVSVDVGQNPQRLELLDLDHDRRVDVVTLNQDSATVSVLKSLGNTRFETTQSFSVGASPTDLAVADLSGDGFADIVAASPMAGSLTVLTQDTTNKTFTSSTITTVAGAELVASGDFNGDSRVDLLVSSSSSGTVFLLLQDSSTAGSFNAPTDLSTGGQAAFLEVGDLNNDGLDDFVVAQSGAGVAQIFIRDAANAGTFLSAVSVTVGGSLSAAQIGDFNNDALNDIAVFDSSGSQITLIMQNIDGSFSVGTSVTSSSGTQSFRAVDINIDGRLDFLIANEDSEVVSILLQDSSNNFAASSNSPVSVGFNPRQPRLADIDGDGVADLVTAQGISSTGVSTVSIALGLSASAQTFVGPLSSPAGPATGQMTSTLPESAVLVDLNNDGLVDVASTSSNQSKVFVRFQSSTTVGSFDSLTEITLQNMNAATDISSGDFDGDGDRDLVVVSSGATSAVAILEQTASGVFSVPSTPVTVASVITKAFVADLQGTGVSKLVLADTNASQIQIYAISSASQLTLESTFSTGTGPVALVIGDLNNDGFLDLVTANQSDLSIHIQDAANAGTFLAPTSLTGVSAVDLILADVNVDGRLDIVTANGAANSVSVFLQNAASPGSFLAGSSLAVGSNASSLAVGDLNFDGLPDIVSGNSGFASSDAGNVSVLFQDSTVGFLAAQNMRAGTRPMAVFVSDFDGDFRPDLLAVARDSSEIATLFGR